ncbi:hypothetical protein DSECCO2_592080 [anaerobic digester metagenome]
MKKLRYACVYLIAALIFSTASPCFAQGTTGSPSPDVDGYVWMKSTDPEKKAFLFGAGTAIALEYQMRAKRSEEPSKFVKGWIEVFDNMSWAEMASSLDRYYDSHPDKASRLVFDVLWHEMIKPNLNN